MKNAVLGLGAVLKGNCLMRRNHIIMMCAGLALLLMGLPAPKSAEATPALGGDLFSIGGDLQIEILPFEARHVNKLHLRLFGEDHFIGTNSDVGTVVNVVVPAGENLDFSITVQDTGDTFHLADAGNPDGIAHGIVDFHEPGIAEVGFEDLVGGGDRDFNDLVFRVSEVNSIINPEPASLVLMGSGVMFLIGWRWRRRNQ